MSIDKGVSIDIPGTLERLCYRYPSPLVDAVTEHEPGRRMVAVKNVTVNEDFFQGHFPGSPVMPGVLMIETLAQVATVLLMHGDGANGRVYLRAVYNAKFRRQVVPGDRLRLEVTLGRSRAQIARAKASAFVDDNLVAEAELVMGMTGRQPRQGGDLPRRSSGATLVDPTAVVHPAASIGEGTEVGPYVVIGEHVRIGRNCRIGASTVIGGFTSIGDYNEIFPLASVGLIPQDLKFQGEPTRLVIGNRNVIREFVTIHRGTAGGGGVTEIGDHNVFMAYAHVAHDCHVGNHIIFGNGATLGGHVTVEDYATISAFSGVHQFCRVGQHAFIGGYSVVTKDALPYAKTVGNRARIYGLNTIGLVRRKFSQDSIAKLRRIYRYLLRSNTSHALAQIERDPSLHCAEVSYVLNFIKSSKRGVGLRRPSRRMDDDGE
ncbi:MAG: acyl-ACP--UDP-N-acetylglucosamine O-acyltransferase [Acidobacteria bacterium]|nr:acyl-ACP--UDP-N-acetylglucosamine O-acyltransferase [Acidobacteriota bacterium]